MLLVGSPLCGSGVGAMGNIYTTPSTDGTNMYVTGLMQVDMAFAISTDGTNMYVTGLMQVDMANAPVCEEPSNPCARANDTYLHTNGQDHEPVGANGLVQLPECVSSSYCG